MRVLGVEAALTVDEDHLCIGVVTRGSKWIDGSFIIKWRVGDLAGLAFEVKSCPYYKELAAVVLSSQVLIHGDLARLSEMLSRPVLMVSTSPTPSVIKYAGLSKGEAEALLKACVSPRGVEPLRLAALLAPMVRALYEAWKPLYLRSA
ncbi:MAG: hypothetical protein DRJ69_06120 [Thermoprotei archaeon]|nr:MAG: hypothetical protein DRJ69_06120 [Thermoprotei archaeon]